MIVAKTRMKKIPELCTECDFYKMLSRSWGFCELKKCVTPYGNILADGFCPLIKVNGNKLK